jgi:solute carrier family 25 (adenine nucleotide translocator) protein 4/5/6/31
LSGTAAGISKSLASPIEVIKIRLQLQQALIEKKTLQDPYTGIINCFQRLYQ